MSYYDHATMIAFQLGPYSRRPTPPFDMPAGSSAAEDIAAAMRAQSEETPRAGMFSRLVARLRRAARRRPDSHPADAGACLNHHR